MRKFLLTFFAYAYIINIVDRGQQRKYERLVEMIELIIVQYILLIIGQIILICIFKLELKKFIKIILWALLILITCIMTHNLFVGMLLYQ